MKEAYEAMKNREDFVLVGLNLDPEEEAPKKYVAEEGLSWPQVFLGEWKNTDVPESFGVRGIPALLLVDPEGNLAAKDLRGEAILTTLQEKLP